MARIILLLWTAGFLVGTTTHAITLFTVGWMPQEHAPLWMNLYWTSLAALDPLTVVLLWTRQRYGVWLGIAVMVTDVAVNSYAAYGLGLSDFGVFLQLQSLFGGFVLGSAAPLLRRE
jgi:hypothetical protein